MRTSTGQPPRALIIGGSMAGLWAALQLRRGGWDVRVFERAAEPLSSRGAGILTHPELDVALGDLGIATGPDFGVSIRTRATLGRDNGVVGTHDRPQVATSWGHVHGLLSAHWPEARIVRGADLTGIEQTADGVTAHFADDRVETADLIVGADGVRSRVRRHLFPELAPTYAGYVAWRGLAPEAAVAKGPDAALAQHFAFCLPPGEQMLGYLVPGPGHALTAGARSYNFVWYRPAEPERALPDLLTDAHGRRHATAIAPDAIAAGVIAAMRADAQRLLAPWFQRVVASTEQPFLQPIFDLAVPQMWARRIALVGDAAVVVRPHVGGGVVKAAEDAAALARHLKQPADIDAALAAYSAERLAIGRRMVEMARRLGSTLNSTYASQTERSATDVVMRDTGSLEFLRVPATGYRPP